MYPSIEAELRRQYPRHEWQPSDHTGQTTTAVYRLSGPSELYVKYAMDTGSPEPGNSPTAEASRLAWLADHNVPCPEVVDSGDIDAYQYLVTVAAPGRAAAASWPKESRYRVIDAVADFAAELHCLPTSECPFDRRLKTTIPLAQEFAGLDEVDMSDLAARYRGWTVTQLVTELLTAAKRVGREEPVVCHGDYCLPNVLVDCETFTVTAIIDVGRLGVADRYTDLALMTRSISSQRLNPQYDDDHTQRFMYRYGELPADHDRIALYRLLDEFF